MRNKNFFSKNRIPGSYRSMIAKGLFDDTNRHKYRSVFVTHGMPRKIERSLCRICVTKWKAPVLCLCYDPKAFYQSYVKL